MGSVDLKSNQKGLLGLNRGSLEMGQQDLNNSVRKVQDVISKIQGLRSEASGIEDGGAELAAKMSAALTAANNLLKELSGVQGYVVSKEASFDDAERKSLEILSKLGITSVIEDIQNMSEGYYSQNQSRIEATKSYVIAQNEARIQAEKAAKWREENPIIGNYVAFAADVSNALVAVGGGLGSVVEDLVDFAAIMGTGAAYPFTLIYDKITGSQIANNMLQNTMSFVAEEHVQNLVQSWYAPGGELSNLNIYAHDTFKSDAIGCQVASGIGYVAGTLALAWLTKGQSLEATLVSKGATLLAKTGAKTFAKRAAVAAGTLGTGRETGNYWANLRDTTPKGKEWRTPENYIKGFGYGSTAGVWEGVQWYTGIRLAGIAISPLARVSFDSIFNAGDTPFRAAMDSIFSEKDFVQAFNERGGWESVLANFTIGGILSGGGELAGLTRVKPKVKTHLTGENTPINSRVRINNKNSRVKINTQPTVSNETSNIFTRTPSRIRRHIGRK